MPLVGYTRDPKSMSITWKLAPDVPTVWDHLTTADRLPEWLGHPRSGRFCSGDTLVVDHGDGYLCTSVVEAVHDNRLSMTWEFPDEPPSHLSVVLEPVTDEEDGGEHCLLHLRHSGLGDLAGTYLPGWITHLTYFEASLETTPLPPQAFWRLYETHYLLTTDT